MAPDPHVRELGTVEDLDAAMVCEAFPDWQGPPVCGERAAGKYRIGCVHEHINEAFVCAACAAEIQRGDNWVCIPCAESAQPHECPVTPEFTWLVSA